MNPYKVLGIPSDASPEAIKRAFRARVKSAHPDVGGTLEEFRSVHTAWRVLSDPERRRRYDETGRSDETPADSRAAQVLALVMQAFHEAVPTAAKQGPVLQQNLIAMMRAALEARIEKTRERAAAIAQIRTNVRQFLGRFEIDDDGANHMEELLAAQLEEMDRLLEHSAAEQQMLAAAVEEVARYRFRRDRPTMILHSWTSGSTTTATGSW